MVTLDCYFSQNRICLQAERHPRTRTLLLSIVPIVILYLFYTLVRWAFVDRAATVGDHNAHTVIRWEEALALDWERPIQSRVMPHESLVSLANHYYVFAFFPVLIVATIIGAIRAPAMFRTCRRVFAVSLAFALILFAIFPLTPPRLLGAEFGFVDTLMLQGPHYYGDESGASIFNAYGSIPSMVNEFAAMPSMHVGWTAIAVVLIYFALGRRWWIGMLAAIHVALMEFAVVATGNHFVVDGLIGLLVVGFAFTLVHSFSPKPVAATEGLQAAPCRC